MVNRRLASFSIGLAVVVILLAGCGGGAEPTAPAEAPAAEADVTLVAEVEKVVEQTVVTEVEKVVEQTVVVEPVVVGALGAQEPTAVPAMPAPFTPVPSFAVVHDNFVELFRDDGVRAAVVDTAGPATVQFAGDKAAVADAQQVRLFDSSGSLAGQGMPVSPNSTVIFARNRVVISQDTFAAIYDAAGRPLVNINTPAQARPVVMNGLIVLIADGWTGAFSLDGDQVMNVATLGEGSLQMVAGQVALFDDASVRFFRADGNQSGAPISLSDEGNASVIGDRVVVAHPGWTDLYAPDGSAVARIATTGAATAADTGGLICLRDDGGIRLFDAGGNQITSALPEPGDAEVAYHYDRVIVIHDAWVGIYRKSGEPLANIATAGRADLAHGDGRFVIADDEVIRFLTLDGQPAAADIRLPGAEIQVIDGRLIATLEGQAAAFDLNGTPLAAIVTAGRPAVAPLPGGLLVVDNTQVRLLSPRGDAWMNLAGLDDTTTVVSRD